MPVNQLYHTVMTRIRQLRPQERITRVRNMAWLMSGIFRGESVHLGKVARYVSSRAKRPSTVRRLERFLSNGHVRVREWYTPIARQLLASQVRAIGEVRLIVDGTKVSFGHQLLMVAIAFRRRALPIAWTWVRKPKGHSSAYKQLALLAYVRRLLPANCTVILVGDSEFGSGEVLQQLEEWRWRYVLRQQSNWLVQATPTAAWQRLDSLISRAGQRRWLPAAALQQKYALTTNVLAYWQPGEKDPWLLATNLPTPQAALRAYQRRMWIDEMFGDFKGHGFDLESSQLRHFLRLSRLTLAVVLLYVWLVAFGSEIIKRGRRHLVDRRRRRDLSVFRIGCEMLHRCLTLGFHFKIRLVPYH
jgi:hypothetical protein